MADVKSNLQDFIIGLRHVGYIVDDLKETLASLTRIYGLTDDQISVTPPLGEDCETRFGFVKIKYQEFEFIEPQSKHFKDILFSSPSGGAGINHVAYTVNDIEGALATLASVGVQPGHVTPDGIINLGDKKMVYLDPSTTDGFLIELIEDL